MNFPSRSVELSRPDVTEFECVTPPEKPIPIKEPLLRWNCYGAFRWAIAALASGVVTASLIMIMIMLLKRDWDLDTATTQDFSVNFLRQDRSEEVVLRQRREEVEPEVLAPRPQLPDFKPTDIPDPGALKIGKSLSPVVPKFLANEPLRFPVSTDGVGAPLVQVAPMYPQALADRGVEGWVTVQFDISAEGRVVSPIVIAAEPEKGFQRAALQAVSRWRYQVLKIDGKPAVRLDNTATIEFRLP